MGLGNLDSLRARLRELRTANGGNVVVMFALASVPMAGFVGAAVDYSHANSVKAAMQAAADSTALMLAKNTGSLTDSQFKSKGTDYFKSLFNRPEATGVTVAATYTTSSDPVVTVKASSNVKTSFMGIMGFKSLAVAVESQVKWSGSTKMQIALALDNTGSMNSDGKLPALKTATKELLKTLENASSKPGNVRVAIIPFAKYVNVGGSNYNQNWIDWSDWDDDNGHDDVTTTCGEQKRGRDGKDKKRCKTSTTWVKDSHSTWNGCVTDRDQDYDVKNTAPKKTDPATLFPAAQPGDCPVELMSLSYDWAALKTKTDEMTANGKTNQGIGLAWAWMALQPNAPLKAPAKSSDTKQVIVLMSDGQNTENRWYEDQKLIDDRQALACQNIKAAGITIYTVLVMAGNSTVLKSCASKPEYYFEVTSASQTVAAFSAIGGTLTHLRVSK